MPDLYSRVVRIFQPCQTRCSAPASTPPSPVPTSSASTRRGSLRQQPHATPLSLLSQSPQASDAFDVQRWPPYTYPSGHNTASGIRRLQQSSDPSPTPSVLVRLPDHTRGRGTEPMLRPH